MDPSPYLARAIQALQDAPAGSGAATPDIAKLQAWAQQAAGTDAARQDFKASHPGQSFTAHQAGQALQALLRAPANMGQGFASAMPGKGAPQAPPVPTALPPY